MKFLDLFSGIGGFRLGMEMAGHECVGSCEIDKFARKSYIEMHNIKEDEWFGEDIKKSTANELPKADVWCFGFPCQDISVAGKQTGLGGQRSGLFYTVIDLIKSQEEENKPRYLFIENVKNLLSVNGGWDFAKILSKMDEAGYNAEWQIINSAWYVPQNRERIFIIGHLRSKNTRKVLPISGTNKKALKQIVGGSQGLRVYDPIGASVTLSSQGGGLGAKTGLYLISNNSGTIKHRNIVTCIDANYHKGLDAHQARTGVETQGRIRRLTPKECFRLQGFPDEYFERAREVNSDTQLYKQAGNSVTVPVIYEIAKRLK